MDAPIPNMLVSSFSKANPSIGAIAWAWTVGFNYSTNLIINKWLLLHHIQLQGELYFYAPHSSQEPARIWTKYPVHKKEKRKRGILKWSRDFIFQITLKRRGNSTLDNMPSRYTIIWNGQFWWATVEIN
jgi:hypothetical protein